MRHAKFRRWQSKRQRELIEKKVRELAELIEHYEAGIEAARAQICKLNALQPGTEQAEQAARYIDFMSWPAETRERWMVEGVAPKKPY